MDSNTSKPVKSKRNLKVNHEIQEAEKKHQISVTTENYDDTKISYAIRKRRQKDAEKYPSATGKADAIKQSRVNIINPNSKQTNAEEVVFNRTLQVGTDSRGTETLYERAGSDWFDRPCTDLAQNLLGMKLVRVSESGERLCGVIVETEAYLGGEDKASHSYGRKKTERNKAMFMAPGTAYVYNIYGIYTCINISSQGEGAAVLIRSLEPNEGENSLRQARSIKKSNKAKPLKQHELCNGPSKLTQALGITKANGNQVDLATSLNMWIETGSPIQNSDIVACKRIGIGYAQEWTDKPLRFYVRGCACVSVRDKEAEG